MQRFVLLAFSLAIDLIFTLACNGRGLGSLAGSFVLGFDEHGISCGFLVFRASIDSSPKLEFADI